MTKQPRANTDDIRSAYRLLLGREPDAGGWDTFTKLIQRDLKPTELAEFFLGSNEFHARRHTGIREISLGNYWIYVRGDDRDVGSTIASGDAYEPHVTAALLDLLKTGLTFLDVGANIGYFTAMAASRVGPTGRVIAVEPMDKNLQLIYATIRRNQFQNVYVHPCAASADTGIVPMGTEPGSSNGGIIPDSPDAHPSIYAQTRRLDDLLVNEERIDIAKFDIEGHELNAWRGYARGLARDRPIILTEFHPKCMRENAGIEPAAYFSELSKYSDRISVLHPHREPNVCASFEELMNVWSRDDARLKTSGGAHLDLLIYPRT